MVRPLEPMSAEPISSLYELACQKLPQVDTWQ